MEFIHSKVQARILLGDISRLTKLNNNNNNDNDNKNNINDNA